MFVIVRHFNPRLIFASDAEANPYGSDQPYVKHIHPCLIFASIGEAWVNGVNKPYNRLGHKKFVLSTTQGFGCARKY